MNLKQLCFLVANLLLSRLLLKESWIDWERDKNSKVASLREVASQQVSVAWVTGERC